MILITKESAFKTFYYLITSDGTITKEETEKLNEIGFQLFGSQCTELCDNLISACESKTLVGNVDPIEAFAFLSECVEDALNDTTEDMSKGIPSRLLIWNLLLIAYSDGAFSQNEQRLMRKINRKLNLGDSVLFEMEQYIKTVQSIDGELDKLKDSMEPYKNVRPVVDELENRRDTIRQAALSLIDDEILNPVEKLIVQDDIIDKAQAAIKEKTDPMMKKVNEQTGKVLGDLKKAATPAAAEAGKKLGKAFMGLGSKLMNRSQSESDGKE